MGGDTVILETTCLFVRQAPCLPGLLREPLGILVMGYRQRRPTLQMHKHPNILEGWRSQILQDLHPGTLRHVKQPPQQILSIDTEERVTPTLSLFKGGICR